MADDYKKLFISNMEDLDRGKDTYTKFSDIMEMSYCAMAKQNCYMHSIHKAPYDKFVDDPEVYEKRYMAIVAKYDKEKIRNQLVAAVAAMINGINAGGDFLGNVAGELSVLNANMGQFFTPFSLSKMMAQMTFDPSIIDEKGYCTLQEPAAGSGGMVIAFAEVLKEQKYNLQQNLCCVAMELNNLSFFMCFLQLNILGIPARVIRMNTLSMEIYEEVYTSAVCGLIIKHGIVPKLIEDRKVKKLNIRHRTKPKELVKND